MSDGARRFASWDPARWDALLEGPGAAVAMNTEPRTHRAYLKMLTEALGLGLLDGGILDLLLVRLAPAHLAIVPEVERVPFLARMWNLGEGLAAQPTWLGRYAAAALGGLTDLTRVEEELVRVLEPALVPSRTSRFMGPFSLRVLDTRSTDDEFLPGDMHLAAPSVVCVHDRRRPIQLGLLLRPQASQLLGAGPCLGRIEGEDGPAAHIWPGTVRFGPSTVALPSLTHLQHALTTRGGFLVASALDSQRLWIVDGP
jgi:hypothetical protein